MAVMLGRCALLFCLLQSAWSQDADVTVTVVDVSDQDVFLNIITAPEALPGLVWFFLTAPGAEPTPTEMKSGAGAVGPASCQDLADAITLPDETLGLVFCNLPYGAEYTLQVYFEGNGTRLLRENVTVPVEPSPLPTGPFCFDIDYDYAGATVESNTTAADSVACQVLCAASATCLHFRYVYGASSPDFQRCDLLSSGPLSGSASPAAGFHSGPQSCDSRSVLYFRPRGNLYETSPTPIVRGIPFTISLKGEHFDTSFDRLVAFPSTVVCGQARPQIAPGDYAVVGTSPATWADWLAMPCNNTGSAPELMICGAPPASVIFSDLGPVRICACDSGSRPFGCESAPPEAFNVRVTVDVVEVTGPLDNNVASCPAGRECTITGLEGYGMQAGDRLMLRENCSGQVGSPAVEAYTGPSRPSPNPSPDSAGSDYIFDTFNTATCPPGHSQGPCMTARICYCAAHPGSTHSCISDTDFQVDAGEVQFFGPPGVVDGLVILQEDFESFTLRWNYPSDDGGGAVTHYNVFFRLCPGGNYSDGVESEYIVPVSPGENQHGLALNATLHFRQPVVGAVPQPIVAATRYCIVVLGTNAAATGRRDIATEFVWVTDVYPPKDLVYADPPLFLVKDEPMVSMVPTVTTADCSNLKSVANTVPQYNASDCQVQHYDIQPSLPTGLSLDPETGVISGTPTELLPRPEIFLVTATNGGGKSSAFISLAVIGILRDATLSSCLRAPTTSELVLSFRTPSEADAPWLQAGAPWPQMLRLRLLRPLLIALRRTTGAALDFLSRSAAIGCGSVVLDATSDAPGGFPPPTLCHWQDSQDLALGEAGAVGARLDMQFQGNATMENDRTYQITFKARLSQLASAGDELLQLTLFASEFAESERRVDSGAFGAWTGLPELPRARAALDPTRPVPRDLPVVDAPWLTARPIYLTGFSNPLLGEAPNGLPFPEGFPAPGVRTCVNFSSYCPTSPHQYVNVPSDTAWYQDTDPEVGVFPSFAVLTGSATLMVGMQSEMLFNPFGTYTISALDSFAGIQADRFLSNRLSFQLDFALSPDISGALTLEQFVTVCPFSSLRMPAMSVQPSCSVLSGPSFLTCTCDPTMPADFVLQRCDRLRIRVNAGGDLRAEITATLRLFVSEDWWPGYQPTHWYVQLQTEHGGINSFRKVANAGFTVWHDFLLTSTTPELCADECLLRRADPITYPTPCNAFKFQTVEQDCYLTSVVESTSTPLQTGLFSFDYYEYQEQVVYATETQEVIVVPGRFFSDISLEARTYLQPPDPSPPPFDVPHFFPSYLDQTGIVCRLTFALAVPIHGQDNWAASLEFVPPAGFYSVSVSPLGQIPTPQGRGLCPSGRRCKWLLAPGQALWPDRPYALDIVVRNPKDPRVRGQLWTIFVATSGFGGSQAWDSVPLAVPHPLPAEGRLGGCSAHFNDPSYMPSAGLSNATLDLFFDLATERPAPSTLLLKLPEAFPHPESCDAVPLTPWLRQDEVSCAVNGTEVFVHFAAYLGAGAALALRLAPFPLPVDFDAVRPGSASWLNPVEPRSLNVRMESVAPGGYTDACHPAVWACSLEPSRVTPRPSQERFAAFTVEVSRAEPLLQRRAWALLSFEVNTSISLPGDLEDALLLSLPHGFSVLGIFGSSLSALRRLPRSGQLNLPEVVDLATAAGLTGSPSDSSLRISGLHGTLLAGRQHFVNLSFEFPESGVEPSLVDPLTRTPHRSACANAWGIAVEAQGVPFATAFASGIPLALVSRFEVDCSTAAAKEFNVLTARFLLTERAPADYLPPGSSLMLVLRFSQLFDLAEPSQAADFAAPWLRSTENGTTLERRGFMKLGCPPMALFALNRRFRQDFPACAVHFNDDKGETELLLDASGLFPGAEHEVQIRLRNPSRAQPSPDVTLAVYRSRPNLDFRFIPLPASQAASQNALQPQQQQQQAASCGQILPAMEAEVFAALCPVPGLATEVTMGFIAPLVLAAPVAATLRAPAGYRIGPACNFEASRLQLPGGRTLDFLLAGFFADCFVHADGRTISFNITRNIKALTSWTFFTIHAQNPPPEELPYNAEQSLWRLDVGGFGASGKMQSPPLRTFQALELRELPFVYNATTRPLLLRFKAFSAVPAGGYVVVDAPPGVTFPEQCQGTPAGIPPFPEQPFRALSSEPLDLVASCSIDAAARSFRITLISGDLPAGLYELRFVMTETDAFLPGPSLWRLESWRPEEPCTSCCSPRRSNFRSVIGLSSIEQLDVAVFYTTLPGQFRSSVVSTA